MQVAHVSTVAHEDKEESQSIALCGRLVIGLKTRLKSGVFEDSTVVCVHNDVPEPSERLNPILHPLRKVAEEHILEGFSLGKDFA